MPEAAYPFSAFNFSVEISVPEISTGTLCQASFAECSGMEMTTEVKTIREGGNNLRQIRMTGPATFGTLTLKRGMTSDDFELWKWFTSTHTNPTLRANVLVVLFAADRTTIRAKFKLERCIPVKLAAPALNAKEGAVAVEELQLAYETLSIESG